MLGRTIDDRKSVFDIYCETEDKDKFIIEIQQVHKPYFMDRVIYYSTFPIQDQSQKGDWNFDIKRTYTICLLNDCFDKKHPDQVVHTFKLVDTATNNELEQLIIYNIELPKFKKTENELASRLDVWLYVLNNLIIFEEVPEFLKEDEIFQAFFMNAELAKYHRDEYMAYVASMKEIWEENAWRTALAEKEQEAITAKAEGKIEGRVEGKAEALRATAKSMLQKGIDLQTIRECTGLDIETLQGLTI